MKPINLPRGLEFTLCSGPWHLRKAAWSQHLLSGKLPHLQGGNRFGTPSTKTPPRPLRAARPPSESRGLWNRPKIVSAKSNLKIGTGSPSSGDSRIPSVGNRNPDTSPRGAYQKGKVEIGQ